VHSARAAPAAAGPGPADLHGTRPAPLGAKRGRYKNFIQNDYPLNGRSIRWTTVSRTAICALAVTR